MADNTVIDRIIDSLAFEVEALPQNDMLEISDTSKATPLNLKIRVRKKDKALFEQGVVSVPKLGKPKKAPEQIRLVSSDHTVLSFKVFVDTHPDKKPAKKHKRFFGGCLSSEDNDDDPYVDSNPATVSRSSDIVNQKFGLSKIENVQDMQLHSKKPVMFLGNRCKPGGCLDPPLDEDKYSYEPNDNNFKISVQEHFETKKQKQDLLSDKNGMKKVTAGLKEPVQIPAEEEISKVEIEPDNKSVQSIYQANFIKSSVDTQYSISIITYPASEIADDLSDKPSSPKRNSDETRKSFPEFQDSYFIPPKTATNSRNTSDADKGTQKIETNFTGRHTFENKRILSKVEPEENTIQNLKSIYDPKIITGIANEEIQSKTSTLLEETSKIRIDANELQREKDLQQLKEGNVVTTALKSGVVLATPLLIAEAAMQKKKPDKDNNRIPSDHEISNNSINTELRTPTQAIHVKKEGSLNSLMEKASESITEEIKKPQRTFDSMSNNVHKKKEEETLSKDENTVFSEKGDTIRDFPDIIKTEKNKSFELTNLEIKSHKDINDTSKTDIRPDLDWVSDEISRITKEDEDISRDYINTQDTEQDKVTEIRTTGQSTDQPLHKHSDNEDYLNKVVADKGLRVISQLEETKDAVPQTSRLMEVDKDSQKISPIIANKDEIIVTSSHMRVDKGSIVSINMDPNNEKVLQTSRIPGESNNINGNTDNNKEEHLDSLTEEQQGFWDKRRQVAEKENDLFYTDALAEHEDLNEDQRKDSLKSKMGDKLNVNGLKNDFQDSDKAQQPVVTNADTQNEVKSQVTNKNQEAALSDNTYNQTQNNDPLENNARYDKNKNDQRESKHENDFSNKYQDAALSDNTFDRTQNNYPSENDARYNRYIIDQGSKKSDEKNQNSGKYEDADLSDNTFDRTQNNDVFKTDAHYDNDKNNQRKSKNEEKNQDRTNDQDADIFDQTQNNDPFENNKHFKQRDTNSEENNQDFNKYQDADISDNTLDQKQSNYPLDANARNNNNKNDQRDKSYGEHMQQFKDYQQTTTTGDNEHNTIIDSVRVTSLQEQDVGKSAHHQVITPHQDKGRIIEQEKSKPSFEKLYDMSKNINKTSEKYDEHYERTSPAYNSVNMDISFHSYINDQNEYVIKTLDTLKDIKRRPQDNVTVLKSQIQLNNPYVIQIPIDNHRNMILEVKGSDYQKPLSSRTAGQDTRGSDNNDNVVKVPSQQSHTSIPESESVQNLLSSIYDQQLVPLQGLISDLKKDIDILTAQQMWLKENWKRSKRAKTIRITHSSRKCVCYRKLNVRK